MKLIDQKGRVLGLINVIDLSVILVLISFLSVVFLGYKVMQRQQKIDDTNKAMIRQQEIDGKKWVLIQIKLSELDPEFSKVILKGDTEKDSSGKTIGELVAIASSSPSKVWVIVDNKMLSAIDHPLRKDIIVDANILCTKRDGSLYYKDSSVKIGNTIQFTTDLYHFSGLITGLKFDDKR